jgi:hypothetical protein
MEMNSMRKVSVPLLVFAIVVLACGPTTTGTPSVDVNSIVTQTMATYTIETMIPTRTATPTATAYPTPTATNTSALTATMTPVPTLTPEPLVLDNLRAAYEYAFSKCPRTSADNIDEYNRQKALLQEYGSAIQTIDMVTGRSCFFVIVEKGGGPTYDRLYFLTNQSEVEWIDYRAPQ